MNKTYKNILLITTLILLTACTADTEPFVANPPVLGPIEREVSSVAEPTSEADSSAITDTASDSVSNTASNTESDSNTDEQISLGATGTIFDPQSSAIDLQLITADLNNPVFVTHAGDGSGRMFVVEQPGLVRIIDGGQLSATPFLDVQDRVRDAGNEQGLLGLAFAPDYANSGLFYVNYTNGEGATRVSRFQRSADDTNRADPASELVLLTIPQPAGNHNGGMITFGPDGYLYIGTGDGGAANDRFGNGQNPDSLLGKMLRIDVMSDASAAYTIPADNPWVQADWQNSSGEFVDVRDEIWAVGLRNPWRFSFDRLTQDLWIGDVGQNKFEEIHFTSRDAQLTNVMQAAENVQPLNYGWPIMEGTNCFSPSTGCNMAGLVQPVAEYDHASGHCSVTGGYVYRGERFSQLSGVYLYGDFCSGVIWALWPHGDGTWGQAEVMKSGTQLSSFGEDEAGELYVTDRSGSLYLVAAEAN